MADKPDKKRIYRDLLDEILYRDPPNAMQNVEVTDGISRMVEVVTFADGSKITITAQVPLPPLADMTPERVFFLKMNGEKGERWDDGSSEAMNLARQSVAVRMMEVISKMLDGIPERTKITCPGCEGGAACPQCKGKGCKACRDSGICQDCNGRGLIVEV